MLTRRSKSLLAVLLFPILFTACSKLSSPPMSPARPGQVSVNVTGVNDARPSLLGATRNELLYKVEAPGFNALKGKVGPFTNSANGGAVPLLLNVTYGRTYLLSVQLNDADTDQPLAVGAGILDLSSTSSSGTVNLQMGSVARECYMVDGTGLGGGYQYDFDLDAQGASVPSAELQFTAFPSTVTGNLAYLGNGDLVDFDLVPTSFGSSHGPLAVGDVLCVVLSTGHAWVQITGLGGGPDGPSFRFRTNSTLPYYAYEQTSADSLTGGLCGFLSPTPTATSTSTETSTITQTPSETLTPIPTQTSTLSMTPSLSPTQTPTLSSTATSSMSPTATLTASLVPTGTSTSTSSLTATNTLTLTFTATPTLTDSTTPTPTSSATLTATPSSTATLVPTASSTSTASMTATPSLTSSSTPTSTPTATDTLVSTATFTATPTSTSTSSMSPTATLTASLTSTLSPSPSPSSTATSTSTASSTPTSTPSPTATASSTPTSTSTSTFTSSSTPTLTATSSSTPTATVTASTTATPTSSPSLTASLTSSPTATASSTPTSTPTSTLTASATPTLTGTSSSTPTETATSSSTYTPTSTSSSTPTATGTSTSSFTATRTSTSTPFDTPTDTPTPYFVLQANQKFPDVAHHTSVDYRGEMWVMGGHDGTGNIYDRIFSSPNGRDWAMGTSMRDKLFGHVSLVYGQGQTYVYVIGGHNDAGPVNDVQRFDGDAWAGPTGAEFQPRYYHSGVVFDGKSGRGSEMWILGGHDESKNDSFDEVWSSNNGSSWVPVVQTKPFAKREQHASVVFDPGAEPLILIIGGYDAGTGMVYKEVLFSNDGKDWNTRTNDPPFGARYGMTAVVDPNRRIWVIGGTDGTRVFDDAWMSNDGASWVEVPGGGDPLTGIERFGHTSLFFDAGKPSIWAIAGFNKLPGVTPLSDVWSSP